MAHDKLVKTSVESETDPSSDTKPSNDGLSTSKLEPASSQYQDSIDRLHAAYNVVSHMTTDDLMIQKNLDQERQLFSNNSNHFLNRKDIVKHLPEEVDLFNPEELKRIEEIYEKLTLLDTDKSVQYKYYKRYLKKYSDPVLIMIQEFNGINKKFKLLRRKESESLSLNPGAYYYNENLLGAPYNVIGFDTTISGLPLRSGKHKVSEKFYPQEFVEDLQMYRTKIPIYKRDLDFIEQEESFRNINPKKVLLLKQDNAQADLSTPEQLNHFFSKIYNQLEIPLNAININSVENYNCLNLNNETVIRVENEILLMKKSLQHEIETVMMKSSLNSRVMIHNNPNHLKHNQYRLYETKSSDFIDSSALVVINHHIKEFNLIPNYALILNTLKQHKNLRNHLYKVFLINLEDQIDILFRIKYINEKEMNRFMKRMIKNIGHTIKFKLEKLFKPLWKTDTTKTTANYDALIFSPYLNHTNCFKRIYWLNNRVRNFDDGVKNTRVLRRSGLQINWKSLDNLVEY
ncbi:uncharacterized protein CANTADRAFT_53269 [Suhomyces tanzawaensis NRRL Y-17324]|uniref:Uncharacterized protein n=1 Tax=Suhomyces tanzawaensis NRRL Y-17324 TaxID=984487 RepID=A0A1E4SH61_9ASCO|nr:uncharacterized protein CANTADRAFT_53269 [Suhomyces tanzawaensis NRRL Y-17324]ODV78815.1 hypothetical protein CANTADRAFT_53269 [Suhomyces tanzawaensis NRRL Y-17324]